jgi:hypothetical protein
MFCKKYLFVIITVLHLNLISMERQITEEKIEKLKNSRTMYQNTIRFLPCGSDIRNYCSSYKFDFIPKSTVPHECAILAAFLEEINKTQQLTRKLLLVETCIETNSKSPNNPIHSARLPLYLNRKEQIQDQIKHDPQGFSFHNFPDIDAPEDMKLFTLTLDNLTKNITPAAKIITLNDIEDGLKNARKNEHSIRDNDHPNWKD